MAKKRAAARDASCACTLYGGADGRQPSVAPRDGRRDASLCERVIWPSAAVADDAGTRMRVHLPLCCRPAIELCSTLELSLSSPRYSRLHKHFEAIKLDKNNGCLGLETFSHLMNVVDKSRVVVV